jgi:hypothetical protein
LLDAQAESVNDTKHNAGIRLRLMSPITGIALGADYNATAGQLHPIFSYVHPPPRGDLAQRQRGARGPDGGHKVHDDRRPRSRVRRIPGREPPDYRSRAPQEPRPPCRSPRRRHASASHRARCRAAIELTDPWVDHTGAGGASSDRSVLARLEALKGFIAADRAGGMRTLEAETRRLHRAMERAFTLALDPRIPPTPRRSGARPRHGRGTSCCARSCSTSSVGRSRRTIPRASRRARPRGLPALAARGRQVAAPRSGGVARHLLRLPRDGRSGSCGRSPRLAGVALRLAAVAAGPPPGAARHAGGARRPGGRGHRGAVHRGRSVLRHQ